VLTFWREGVKRRFYVDGVLVGETSASSEPTQIGDLLLFEYPNAASFRGQLAELLIYDSALSDVEIQQTQNNLKTKWAPLLTRPDDPLLVFVGNSLTTGMFCGNGKTWTAFVGKSVSDSTGWYNVSKGGITTDALQKLAPTYVDAYLNGRTGRKVLVLWEGTNDLVVNQATAEQAANRIGEFCSARRKAGWDRVIVLNVLPREALPHFEERRQELNRLLSADPSKFSIDALVDVAAVPEIGNADCEKDKTYYVDGVHLNSAGQRLVADAVIPVLRSLTDGTFME
jgi:lysophospholipase L1-like esterase